MNSPMHSAKIGVLLLAAGLSRRFGQANKLLTSINGTPLVQKSAKPFEPLGFAMRIAVVSDKRVEAALPPTWTCHYNAAPEAGVAGSIRIGVNKAIESDLDWLAITLGDMPHISETTVENLFNKAVNLGSQANRPIAPVFTAEKHAPDTPMRPGHPVFWPKNRFGDLENLGGDQGARALLRASFTALEVNDPGIYRDIDTPSDIETSSDLDVSGNLDSP